MKRRSFLLGSLAAPIAAARARRPAPRPLPRRALGRTGLSVSLLGFGWGQKVEGGAVLRRAAELGVSYFHLGHAKGEDAPEAAAALRPFRQRIVVGCMTLERSADAALLELERFLLKTGLGYVDVWYFVTPTPEQRAAFCDAFGRARRDGKARFAGITTHGLANHIDALTAPASPIDAVMLVHNFQSPEGASRQVDALRAADLAIVPMKPMAGNVAALDPGAIDPFHGAALRWLAADTRVASIPAMMTSVEQVEHNAAALQRALSDADRALLGARRSKVSAAFCSACGACEGQCPERLGVGELVRVAMYAEGYGDVERARLELAALPPQRRADACASCGACAVRCPSGVAVRERLGVARSLLA